MKTIRTRGELIREVSEGLESVTNRFVARSRTMRWSMRAARAVYGAAPFLFDGVMFYSVTMCSVYEAACTVLGLYIEHEQLHARVEELRSHFVTLEIERRAMWRDFKETRSLDEVQRRIVRRTAERIVDAHLKRAVN